MISSHAAARAALTGAIAIAMPLLLTRCWYDLDPLQRASDAVDDAAARDGTVPGDGSSPTDGSSAPFCAAHHDLCEDFDSDAGLTAWQVTRANGGQIGIDSDAFVSPPSSLDVSLGTGRPQGMISRSLTASAHVICELKIRIETASNPGAPLLLVNLDAKGQGVDSYALTFGFDQSQATLTERGTRTGGDVINVTHPFETLARGSWQTVRIDAMLSTEGGSAEISYGSNVFGPFALVKLAAMFDAIDLGIAPSDNLSAPIQARFDDVACDAK